MEPTIIMKPTKEIVKNKKGEAKMKKRERVIAAIEQKEVDGIPSSFSLHFPAGKKTGDAAVEAHLKFFEETDMDIVKIMNEYRLPVKGMLRTPDEYYEAIPMDYRHSEFFRSQIEMTKKIMDRADHDAFSMGTLHGIWSTSFQPFMCMGSGYIPEEARQMQIDFMRWNESKMLDVMERISDGLCDMAAAYIKEAGLDAVYYSSQGGPARGFTDEEFARWIKPYDLKVMKAIKDAGGYCVLHICQSDVDMNRYTEEYAELADVVNWGVYDVPMSLEDGRKHFKNKTVFGGLANHSGVMVNGTEEDVRKEVRQIVEKIGRTELLFGPVPVSSGICSPWCRIQNIWTKEMSLM